jgi:hypothetical protein
MTGRESTENPPRVVRHGYRRLGPCTRIPGCGCDRRVSNSSTGGAPRQRARDTGAARSHVRAAQNPTRMGPRLGFRDEPDRAAGRGVRLWVTPGSHRRPRRQSSPPTELRLVSVGEAVGCGSLSCANCWSEWQDLNLRPPRPERGARPQEGSGTQFVSNRRVGLSLGSKPDGGGNRRRQGPGAVDAGIRQHGQHDDDPRQGDPQGHAVSFQARAT